MPTDTNSTPSVAPRAGPISASQDDGSTEHGWNFQTRCGEARPCCRHSYFNSLCRSVAILQMRRRMRQRPPARVPARHRGHPWHPGLPRRHRQPRWHDLQHRWPVHSLVPRRRRPVAALGRELRRLHHGDVHRRRVGLVRHGDRLRRHPLPELRLRGQPRRMVYHRCLPRHQRVLPLPGSDRRAPCLARSRRADTRLRHTERRYGPQLLLAGLLTTESAPLTRLVPS